MIRGEEPRADTPALRRVAVQLFQDREVARTELRRAETALVGRSWWSPGAGRLREDGRRARAIVAATEAALLLVPQVASLTMLSATCGTVLARLTLETEEESRERGPVDRAALRRAWAMVVQTVAAAEDGT